MDGSQRYGWIPINKRRKPRLAPGLRATRRGTFELLEARQLLSASSLYKEPIEFSPPETASIDRYGSIAVDNGYVVVGSPGDDLETESAGSAFLYLDKSSRPIVLQSPDAAENDRFGANVAIAGLKVAIAESGDDFDENTPNSGAVHIYDIPTASWKRIAHPDPHKDSQFGGNGLALTTDVLLVSSNNRSTDTPIASKVYAINPTTGAELRSFSLPGPQRPVVSEIDVDGDWVLIGSSDYEEIYTTTDVGRAFLWNWRTGDSITIENPSADMDDFFGEAVAINGSTLVISAPGDDTDGTNYGLAYIYEFDPTTGTVGSFVTVSNPDPAAKETDLPSTPNFEQGFGQSIEIQNGLIYLGSVSQYPSDYTNSSGSSITIVDASGYRLGGLELPNNGRHLGYIDPFSPFTVRQGLDLTFDDLTGELLVVERSSQPYYGIHPRWQVRGQVLVYEPAFGNTFTVNSMKDTIEGAKLSNDGVSTTDGDVTLRAAINAANASDSDSVIILPPGTYQLDLAGNGNFAGDLDIDGNITILGAGAGLSVIDASELTGERIFDVMGTLNLSGVTLTGADISSGENGLGGAAIWVRSTGTLELNESVITGNTAGSIGGGIYNAGSLTVNRSVISQNISGSHGGGVRNVGTARFNGSVIARNAGNPDGPDLRGQFTGDGLNMRTSDVGSLGLMGSANGAVDLIVTEFADHADAEFDGGDLSLREAIISANAAGGPVTIWLPAGHHRLDLAGAGDKAGDLDISGDVTIVGPGAGLAIIDASGLTGERIFDVMGKLNLQGVTLTGANITEGTNGTSGGAVWVRSSGTLNLQESAITGNTAGNVGGGIYSAGKLNIIKSVITNNRASSYGGGIRAVGMATVSKTIIANNNSNNSYQEGNVYGIFSSDGTNRLTRQGSSEGFRYDYFGSPRQIVTSVEDRIDRSDDTFALTLREAIENQNSRYSWGEVWLPAWTFNLTLEGDGGVEIGSIDIERNLRLRGISETDTVVDATAIKDKAFESTDVSFNRYDVTTIDG